MLLTSALYSTRRTMKVKQIEPRFVDAVPANIEDGIIYISIRFRTAIHRCCCGCGVEVTTPIRPMDWSFCYDGSDISLSPSIGNWSFNCRSHYWIRRGLVIDAPAWSRERISANRMQDYKNKGVAEVFEQPEEGKRVSLLRSAWGAIRKLAR